MDPNKSKRTFQRLVTRQMFENQSDLEIDIQSSEEKQQNSGSLSDTNSFENILIASHSPPPKNEEEETLQIGSPTIVEFVDEQQESSYSSSQSADIMHYSSSCIDSENEGELFDGNASSNVENTTWRQELENNLNIKIARIAIKHRHTHCATNDYLALFRELGHEVSKDARTILGTTRCITDDNFEHFGLLNGIVKKIRKGVKNEVHQLNLIINIDGIPLYRSSKINFWPILGRIINCEDIRPFVISVYSGRSKPPDLKTFLSPFLEEMKRLEKRSLTVDGRSFHVILKSVICDAPARSFVKATIGQGGFHGCERCVQKGGKVDGCMTFPAVNSDLRSDKSFRQKRNKQHYTGTSPFTELDSLNMIHGNKMFSFF